MLYSVMSTKFRRAFTRILSCRSQGWQESRTEITFNNPSVSHVMPKKCSSKIEMIENKRRKTHHSKSCTEKNSYEGEKSGDAVTVSFQSECDTDPKREMERPGWLILIRGQSPLPPAQSPHPLLFVGGNGSRGEAPLIGLENLKL